MTLVIIVVYYRYLLLAAFLVVTNGGSRNQYFNLLLRRCCCSILCLFDLFKASQRYLQAHLPRTHLLPFHICTPPPILRLIRRRGSLLHHLARQFQAPPLCFRSRSALPPKHPHPLHHHRLFPRQNQIRSLQTTKEIALRFLDRVGNFPHIDQCCV